MALIIVTLSGTFFLVLGLQLRARSTASAAAIRWLIGSGIFGLSLAYYMVSWQEPSWVRLGVPAGALVGGILGTFRAHREIEGKKGNLTTWAVGMVVFALVLAWFVYVILEK